MLILFICGGHTNLHVSHDSRQYQRDGDDFAGLVDAPCTSDGTNLLSQPYKKEDMGRPISMSDPEESSLRVR